MIKPNSENSNPVPVTLLQKGAIGFWIAVVATGIGAGLAAAFLTLLLEFTQKIAWKGSGQDLINSVTSSSEARHIVILLLAGMIVIFGQFFLRQLTSANGIDINEAIWFRNGRLPAIRTLGSSLLSIFIVGMGVSLGREGAPKQTAAVLANFLRDRIRLSRHSHYRTDGA